MLLATINRFQNVEMETVPFSKIRSADLQVDAIYQGGRSGNAGDDPLPHLLNVSNSGGFRYRGNLDALELVVLTSSLKDPDWPDHLDPETGIYTYYGDNKRPGRGLHDTPRKGNQLLRRIYELAHSGADGRLQVPPVFIFGNSGRWRDVVFHGLAIPGTADLRASEDLVAIWRIADGKRFQNYRARFTVLDVPVVERAWLNDIVGGSPHTTNAPTVWRHWVETSHTRPLIATRSIEYRTKAQQLPQTSEESAIVERIHSYFSPDPHAFEKCAASLAKLLMPDIAAVDLTRPSRDGGRDAIGQLRIGAGVSGILVDFALEAKCYSLTSGVGVRDMSRLISRLRHRQFGILVTTSYVDIQAYREIKEDQHPIIILSATDIAKLLRDNGYSDINSVQTWLKQSFPLGV